MSRKRFKEEQIIAILREAERTESKAEVFRKHGISEQTFYRWKKQYGGSSMSEIQAKKALEKENLKLKQLVGDQALAIQGLKEQLKKKEMD